MSLPGIAATVDRDPDLASHPAVLAYHKLENYQDALRSAMVGINSNGPLAPGKCEFIDVPEYGVRGVRLWASYTGNPDGSLPNEKIVAWWCVAEPRLAGPRARPYQREYGTGNTHVFVRYLLRVGSDTLAADAFGAGKLPGMTGTYDVYSESIVPPYVSALPQPSRHGCFEARLLYSVGPDGNIRLGVYYYGVRNPNNPDGSPGLPASLGRYDGSGNPAGHILSSGILVPDQWHCIEQEVKLNTVKDAAAFYSYLDSVGAEAACLANANSDGEMRVWLDRALVYEKTTFAFRGMDRVRIQSIPFVNIYQGGRGLYPKAPEHYDLCALVAATEYVGPPVRRSEPQAAVPAVRQTLGSLAASMAPGTWAELIAEDIDAVVGVGQAGNTEVAIPYSNSAPWCPIRKRIVIVSSDHGDAPIRHIEYDDATNKWSLIDRGIGSHQYQQVAVDPYSGDIYQRYAADLYRYTGQTWVSVSAIPFNISQIASVALAWWSGPYPGAGGHGVLTVYSGNTGTISAFDPTRGSWLADLTNMLPGQLGHYHVVSAYSSRHNCLVYGGGYTFQAQSPVDRQIWRLNADLSKTRMPDAPHHVGIFSGMNLVSDSASGNIIAFGFGEAWELNPSGAGSWTLMTGARAAPDGLLSPDVPNSVISCDVTSFGVVVYVDALRTRNPRCRMWVYKSASVPVNATVAAANYEGQWWNAPAGSEAGWGINFAHQGDVIFAMWFTHDANGSAWYLSMTAFQTGPNTFAGTLYRTTGPPLDANPFDPNQVQRIEVGAATLTFSDGSNGTFAYTVNGISQTKSITRQVFGPLPTCTWGGLANLALATNYQGLWWVEGGVESGWGINFSHQGDVVFASWFIYDFTGAALPLSATLTKVGPATWSGSLIRTSGPAFFAVPFDPGAVTRTNVGTATVTFSNGNAATFSYEVSLGGQSASGTKTITRQVFRAPGTVCQ